MDWLIELIVTGIPDFFEEVGHNCEVVVTAIPDFGVVAAVGIFGVIAFVFIFGMDYLVNGE